jgi:membrane-associated phospholipid phosphatase
MIAITDLGDSGVLLPVAGLILLILLWLHTRRTALWWASTIALCAFATVAAKVALHACVFGWSSHDLVSPSGHTSLSTTVYGSCAFVVASETSRWRRIAALATGVVIVAAIALSRVYVHAHTGPEVVAGLLIGAACVSWFAYGCRRSEARRLPWQAVITISALAIAATYGAHLDFEALITALARHLGTAGAACPSL